MKKLITALFLCFGIINCATMNKTGPQYKSCLAASEMAKKQIPQMLKYIAIMFPWATEAVVENVVATYDGTMGIATINLRNKEGKLVGSLYMLASCGMKDEVLVCEAAGFFPSYDTEDKKLK